MDKSPQYSLDNLNTEKAIKVLGKKEDGKTVFRLPQEAHDLISGFVKGRKGITKKKFIGMIAGHAAKAAREGSLKARELPKEAVRKSYAVSEEAKKDLQTVCQALQASRDEAFLSGLEDFLEKYAKRRLKPEEILENAKIIQGALDDMAAIWERPEVKRAYERISDAWDEYCGERDDLDLFALLDSAIMGSDFQKFIDYTRERGGGADAEGANKAE